MNSVKITPLGVVICPNLIVFCLNRTKAILGVSNIQVTSSPSLVNVAAGIDATNQKTGAGLVTGRSWVRFPAAAAGEKFLFQNRFSVLGTLISVFFPPLSDRGIST